MEMAFNGEYFLTDIIHIIAFKPKRIKYDHSFIYALEYEWVINQVASLTLEQRQLVFG